MNTASYSTMNTPIGPFTAIVSPDGAVLGSGWTADPAELTVCIASSLTPKTLREVADLGPISAAIKDYHSGRLTSIDDIVVRQHSGEFVTCAWDVLRTVQPGDPVSYTDYAKLAGKPAAVRAAAMACARNAAALFVPCHRVVRTDGSLGGFRWGLAVKRWLLDHESTHRLSA